MININQKPQDYQNLFLDMDSFFASVEKQVRPKIRNQPIGVTPYAGNTGCIIAKCYQAKKYGISTGCLVGKAKKLCPKIKIIKARPELYTIYHKQIKKVISNLTPFYKPLSVDEFLIDLSQNEQNEKQSLKLAQKMKSKIKKEVGDFLTCSVGISSNYLLSKMAAESNKPDGKVVLRLNNLESFFKTLKLTDIPGISFKMEKRLNKINIKTPLDFLSANREKLVRSLGVNGRSWFYRLKGYQLVKKGVKSKTIGHSHVLPPDYRSKRKATQVIKKLAHKVGARMRKDNYYAKGVKLSIGFFNNYNFKRSRKTAPFSSNSALQKHIGCLLNRCQWKNKPLKVSLRVYNLTKSYSNQSHLFKDLEKSRKISQAIDKINDKFQDSQMISFAGSFEAKKTAPDRIAFSSIPKNKDSEAPQSKD